MTTRISAYCLLLFFYILSSKLEAAIDVSGKVKDDQDKPIRGAEAILLQIQNPVTTNLIEQMGQTHSVPAARALTNDKGEYHLDAPIQGLWVIQIRAPGFISLEMLLSPLLENDVLPAAKMIRDTGLTVRVLSPTGTPVPEALVIADDEKEPSLGRDPWLPSRRAGLTSAEGIIRFAAGTKENLTVSVHAKGYAFLEKKQLRGPSVSLSLSAGVSSKIEVFGRDDKPVPGASIQLGMTSHPLGLTDKAGRIEVRSEPKEKILYIVNTRDERRYIGQLQPKADPAEPIKITLGDTISFKGKVLNRENRTPIAGALVWTTGARWNVAVCEKDGTFSLDTAYGNQFLRAASTGFTLYQNNDPQGIDPKGVYTIVLQPEAQLYGIVLTPRNEPVSGAELELLTRSSRYRFSFPESKQKRTTTETGTFRFARLNPEYTQTITIRAEGYARTVLEENVPSGKKKQLRIVLTPEISAIGKVVDVNDRPLGGIPVSIKPSVVEMSGAGMIYSFSETKKIESQTETNGTFRIGELRAGKYDLEAGGKGFSKYQKIGLEIPESRKPVDLGTIVLPPGIALEGRVLDLRKQPVEGAQIHVRPNDPWTGYWGEEDPSAVSGTDGFFIVPDQTPGSVIDMIVKRTGFIEKKLEEFPIPPREPLAIILEPTSRISGIVVDSSGQPIPSVSLQLSKRIVRGTFTQHVSRHSETGKNDGSFEFRDVAPDRYALMVRAAGWQDYEMEGIEVNQGKDVTDLKVTLLPEAILEGTVLMSDGEGAIGASIKTASEEFRGRYRPGTSQAWTDGSGNYALHGLKPGKSSIEATHQEAPRQVKEIDLKPGSNRLDFQLEGGYPVSGRTQDESGAAVSNVSIRIYTSGLGLSATSGEDGTFSIKSVPNGEHSLEIEKEGYTITEQLKVQVNGAPVEGYTITLKKGAIIQGQILGLPAEKLSLVYVEGYCESPDGYATTKVDYQGTYYLRSISAGKWVVSAGIAGGGASVSKTIIIEPRMTEAHLDLEFTKGITLDGTVLSGESPVSNVWVRISGKETQSWASTTTHSDGSFHVEGLTKGKHKLSVSNWQEGWEHHEDLDLQDNQKITVQIPSNRITGTVFDARDRSPLGGATVSLVAANANPTSSLTIGTITDSTGRFVLKNAIPGDWMLAAKKEGYGTQNQAITIEDKSEISGIEFLLQPTGGITLEIRNAFGLPMETSNIAVINAAGQILSIGTYYSQGNGRFRISTIPSGTWELLLSDYNSAQTSLTITVPQSEPVKVTLQPASRLRVKVPALVADPAIAKMTLTGSDGRLYRNIRSWSGTINTEFDINSGEMTLDTLPPGAWNIRVVAPDGRQWQKTATTSPATLTEAVLE